MRFFRCIALGLIHGMGLWGAEKGTADFYQSSPEAYLEKPVSLRVVSLASLPELDGVDKGFIWVEANTGRPNKEEGRILLRIPEADAVKLVKAMNMPSSSGRWLEGVFSGHDSGVILPGVIARKAPYYIEVSHPSPTGSFQEDKLPVSGSLIISPKPKESIRAESPKPGPGKPTGEPSSSQSLEMLPKAVVLRDKVGGPCQLRFAQSFKMESEFCEIIDRGGKLSLVGRTLVVAILPLPKEGVVPASQEVEAALRLYAEQAQKTPEIAALLLEAKASWERWSSSPNDVAVRATMPDLEDVETAAGMEEYPVEADEPTWFLWSSAGAFLLLIFLGWVWSRPCSYRSA